MIHKERGREARALFFLFLLRSGVEIIAFTVPRATSSKRTSTRAISKSRERVKQKAATRRSVTADCERKFSIR